MYTTSSSPRASGVVTTGCVAPRPGSKWLRELVMLHAFLGTLSPIRGSRNHQVTRQIISSPDPHELAEDRMDVLSRQFISSPDPHELAGDRMDVLSQQFISSPGPPEAAEDSVTGLWDACRCRGLLWTSTLLGCWQGRECQDQLVSIWLWT